MKALKYILFLLLILVIGFAIYVAVQPNEFSVTRTRTLQAPQQMVFNNVNDFKNWEAWSSWKEEKPETIITLNENTKGVGGSYSWEEEDGAGTMKTTAVNPYESIEQEMQFAEFPASQIQWNFKPTADGKTDVTWNIAGKDLPFVFKFFSVLMGGMEKQIGPHFERGLEKLDSILITDMSKYDVKINGVTEYGGGFYLYKTTNANNNNISAKMGENYGSIMQFMGASGAQMAGMPLTVYNEMNNENGTVIMSNGIPIVSRVDIPEDSDISIGFMPKMNVLKTTLTGNYTNLEKGWSAAMKHLAENGLEQSDQKPFEIYTNDPGQFPNPADWKTEIYIPLKE